jgi:altronate hydrolase
MQEFIRINNKDNVLVALTDLAKGSIIEVEGARITLIEDILRGHKFTLKALAKGDNVIKYGFPIGHLTRAVEAGSWVHTQNIKTNLGDVLTYQYEPKVSPLESRQKVSFMGYRRGNGKVGIRNEIWIIPTVGCVNNIASAMERKFANKVTGSIEGITAFPHPYGCSQMGDDQENTRTILADLMNHPNAGGVLVLGLGCENSNILELKRYIGEYDENRIKFLQCQDVEDEMEEANVLIDELVIYTSKFHREPIDVDELVIGMKCGGSDGMSGITANPTVGAFSDILISQGGTTVLTEVPEMFGAETLLMARCQTKELFDKTVDLINDFKKYFTSYNQTIYENPSPGNKKGGISTLEDKSLGCTQKSGTAPISDVLKYGEVVRTKGLNLLSAPGNDLVASTALAAAGCHMVLFTTGRGTPFASPVPTMKISTNTPLASKKSNWIDFNTGTLVEGKTLDLLGEELFQYVVAVASGTKVKSEEAGFHDMAIFKQGVTL